jgi:thiol-disulfide isomerase/thioredoxin
MKKNFGLILLISLLMSLFSLSAKAQDLASYDVYGKPFHLAAHPGKWVVINYWATWCTACIQEIPELNRFAEISPSANAIFFAVNFDHMAEDSQRDFARKYRVGYTLLRDNPLRSLIPEETISSLPMTYIISPQGEVTQLFGRQTFDDLLHMIT